MIIGASLGSFKGLSLKRAMEVYSKLSNEFDLRAVEIRFEKEGVRPAVWHWEANKIREFIRDYEISGAHLPFVYLNPISQNPYIKKLSISQLESAIEIASNLDMNYCVMHARGFNYALTQEQQFEEWEKVIEELLKFAEENSILLTIENADFLHDLSLLVKLVKEINSKWLKITFDMGHAHIRKIAPLYTYPVKDLFLRTLDIFLPLYLTKKNMPYETYISIKKFIMSELDLISVIHLHDYNGRSDHLPIGVGKIDFSFLSELKSKFKGPYILEVVFKNHYEDFRESCTNIRRLLEI